MCKRGAREANVAPAPGCTGEVEVRVCTWSQNVSALSCWNPAERPCFFHPRLSAPTTVSLRILYLGKQSAETRTSTNDENFWANLSELPPPGVWPAPSAEIVHSVRDAMVRAQSGVAAEPSSRRLQEWLANQPPELPAPQA